MWTNERRSLTNERAYSGPSNIMYAVLNQLSRIKEDENGHTYVAL